MTETERKTLVVDESGAGDYRTLTEAVAACAATPDEPVRFYIRHGIYEERPFIELADYVIEGEYRNATVITRLWAGATRGRARSRPAPSAAQRYFWAAAGPLCAT
mgnify:FL=1